MEGKCTIPKRMSGPGLPKGHMKTGHIQVKGDVENLEKDYCMGLTDPSVQYSLNKKARWRLVDAFRDDDKSLHQDDCKITAVEKVYDENHHSDCKEVAFHSVDTESGDITHRFPNKTKFAQLNTLSNVLPQDSDKSMIKLALPRLRRRKDHRAGGAGSMNDVRDDGADERTVPAEVRFEVHTPCYSIGKYLKNKEVNSRKFTKDRRAGRLQQKQVPETVEDWELEWDASVNDHDFKAWEAEDMDVAEQVLKQDPTWELVDFDQLLPDTMELDLIDLLVPGKVRRRKNGKKRFNSECDGWELV